MNMKRYSILASMLMCFVVLTFVSTKNSQSAALPIHNLDTGLNYATINQAIQANETKNGNTILIDSGVYHEFVNLYKELRIVGQGRESTIISLEGLGQGIYASPGASNFYFARFTVEGATNGFTFDWGCRDFTISDVAIKNCTYGIVLGSYHNALMINTYITDCVFGIVSGLEGIGLTLQGNVISNCESALSIGSHDFVMTQNALNNNKYNFGDCPSMGEDWTVDISNTIDGNPIYYIKNDKNRVIEGENLGFLGLINCVDFTISGLNLTRNFYGMFLESASNCTIHSNVLSGNEYGMFLTSVSNVEIYDNRITKNAVGLSIEGYNNKIAQNIFKDNDLSAMCMGSNNVWDAGYNLTWVDHHPVWTGGGNFWSDYKEKNPDAEDAYFGSNQDQLGADGIWDRAYGIGSDVDHYPLVNEPGITSTFKVPWKGVLCTVTASCNGWARWFNFNNVSKTMSFEVLDSSFVDITVPKELLDGAIAVLVDGQIVSSVLVWNETHITAKVLFNPTEKRIVDVVAEYATYLPIAVFPDINNDGEVNILDITIVAKHFREKR